MVTVIEIVILGIIGVLLSVAIAYALGLLDKYAKKSAYTDDEGQQWIPADPIHPVEIEDGENLVRVDFWGILKKLASGEWTVQILGHNRIGYPMGPLTITKGQLVLDDERIEEIMSGMILPLKKVTEGFEADKRRKMQDQLNEKDRTIAQLTEDNRNLKKSKGARDATDEQEAGMIRRQGNRLGSTPKNPSDPQNTPPGNGSTMV